MKGMDDPLSLENRRRLYHYIVTNPGAHLREIERGLSFQPGLLSYHLNFLQERQLIRSEDDGNKKRFFPASSYRLRDRKVIALIRQTSTRRILMHLLTNGPTSFGTLKEEMRVSKSTLSYHLKKMTSYGVVVFRKSERENIYSIQNPDVVADSLIEYAHSLNPDAVERFCEIWDMMSS